MRRERTVNGVRSNEAAYYLSSEEKVESSYHAALIMEHRGVENELHGHLNVRFKEDQCRVHAKNGAVNLASMRKYALEMLKKHNDKLSLKRRRNIRNVS